MNRAKRCMAHGRSLDHHTDIQRILHHQRRSVDVRTRLTLEFELESISCTLGICRSLLVEVWAGLLSPISRKSDVSITIIQCRIGQGSTAISKRALACTMKGSLHRSYVHIELDEVKQQEISFIGNFNRMRRVCQPVGEVQDISSGSLVSTASNRFGMWVLG